LVEREKPCFIHKTIEVEERNENSQNIITKKTELTFMIGKYALPWKSIAPNIPLCDAVITKIEKVKKAFPKAHIEFNFNRENPAFLFNVVGRTQRHENDEPNQDVGDTVAMAKATARACAIAKAIIQASINGLEVDLKRNLKIFEEWNKKEKNIIKEM
jgi:hypothetical protein